MIGYRSLEMETKLKLDQIHRKLHSQVWEGKQSELANFCSEIEELRKDIELNIRRLEDQLMMLQEENQELEIKKRHDIMKRRVMGGGLLSTAILAASILPIGVAGVFTAHEFCSSLMNGSGSNKEKRQTSQLKENIIAIHRRMKENQTQLQILKKDEQTLEALYVHWKNKCSMIQKVERNITDILVKDERTLEDLYVHRKNVCRFQHTRQSQQIKQKPLVERNITDVNKTANEPVFIRLEFEKERFQILKYSCETIKGILTICEQDFPNAFLLVDNHLNSIISTNSVIVYTTDEFRHHFERDSKEAAKNMSAHGVIETINQTNVFALIVIGSKMQAFVMNALKESDIRYTAVLVVGKTDELPVFHKVIFSRTQPETLINDANVLLKRCAFAILKIVHLNLRLYESHNTFTGQEKTNLLDVYDLIMSAFKRSAIPRSEWPEIETENPPNENPPNIDTVIEDIACYPAVIGCLKKRGSLQIYLNASKTGRDDENLIRQELQKHGIAEYVFLYGTTTNLSSSGDSIFGGHGTLGGFVKKIVLPSVEVRSQSNDGGAGATFDQENTIDHTV